MVKMRIHRKSIYNRNQKLFIAQGMLGLSASTITSGVFLTGFLAMMGTTDLMMGVLNSASSWTLLLSLLSSFIIEKIQHRKRFLILVLIAYKLLTILPVFIPLVLGINLNTATLVAMMIIIGYLVNTISTTDMSVFMLDSVPQKGREHYIYIRMLYIRVANTVLIIAAGILMDSMNKSYSGFIILFSIALVLSVFEVLCLNNVHGDSEIRENVISSNKEYIKMVLLPFKNKRYLNFLIYSLTFFFFYFMSSSYISVYQYKYLELSYKEITIYNTAIFILMILVTRFWANIERKIGQLKVLVLTSLLIVTDFIIYAFINKHTLWLLSLSVIFSGLGGAGLWACLLSYRYNLMPKEGKTIFEAWNGTFYAIAALSGTLVGGKLHLILPEWNIGALNFNSFQLTFLLSGIIAIISVIAFSVKGKNV